MKRITLTILTIAFFQLSANAQFFKGTIIKTRPYQDLVAYNPTIGIEKPIHRIFSIESEFMYRNRNWNSSGGEWDFGRFYDGDGFRIMVGSRVYFGKTNKHLDKETQKSPFGWFGAVQLGYSQSKTYNIERRATTSGTYQNTVEVEKNWTELNIGIGRQFYLFKTISLDFFLGPSIYFAHSENTTITASENLNEIGIVETEHFGFGDYARPKILMAIGYYFK